MEVVNLALYIIILLHVANLALYDYFSVTHVIHLALWIITLLKVVNLAL